jgi:hypothetical protein
MMQSEGKRRAERNREDSPFALNTPRPSSSTLSERDAQHPKAMASHGVFGSLIR